MANMNLIKKEETKLLLWLGYFDTSVEKTEAIYWLKCIKDFCNKKIKNLEE